jgi:hypothetical protein
MLAAAVTVLGFADHRDESPPHVIAPGAPATP